ncbi:MAG TPA: cupin domain-containing protein [Caulobacterales bacterium]|nr:cupin domain-containing protein [Caulobacterales bacterium]
MDIAKALLALTGALALLAASPASAQGPAQTWWIEKTAGGAYRAPMRPLWRLADLKKMHAGQDNWSEQIIKDAEQDVTYNSGKPGFKIAPRIKPDTASLFVVIAGAVAFDIEGQAAPIVGVRGSIVNVPKGTIYSAEVTGAERALWVEINPINYITLYPSSGPQPAPRRGGKIVTVWFSHTPGAYKAPNTPHWNLFTAIAACERAGLRAADDHLYANPLITYPPGDKCNKTPAAAPAPAAPAAFNPKSTFGHMHAVPAEWWIVQSGGISGKFENTGEFHAVEGDVLYAPPMMWHQMDTEGPGNNVRLALGGYDLKNLNNTATPVAVR